MRIAISRRNVALGVDMLGLSLTIMTCYASLYFRCDVCGMCRSPSNQGDQGSPDPRMKSLGDLLGNSLVGRLVVARMMLCDVKVPASMNSLGRTSMPFANRILQCFHVPQKAEGSSPDRWHGRAWTRARQADRDRKGPRQPIAGREMSDLCQLVSVEFSAIPQAKPGPAQQARIVAPRCHPRALAATARSLWLASAVPAHIDKEFLLSLWFAGDW